MAKPKQQAGAEFKALDPSDPRYNIQRPSVELTTCDGAVVNLNAMNIPEDLKDLVETLDFDGGGKIDSGKLQLTGSLLKTLQTTLNKTEPEEMQEAILLMMRLVEARKNNSHSMEYGHLPEGIQRTLRTWDVNKSGDICETELRQAAEAWQKLHETNRLMKRVLFAAVAFMILMFVGMFAMGMITADLAKDFVVNDDASMKTKGGVTSQTANSDTTDFNGKLASRSNTTASCAIGKTCVSAGMTDPVVKLATSSSNGKLKSTLPDSAFDELKSITLSATNGNNLKLTITSYKRVQVRSSLCGSIVRVQTTNGVLTLDDVQVDADATLMSHAKRAGMDHIFRNVSPLGAGRRLASTDGMLAGFFNSLDDMEWACTSQTLAPPESMASDFVAKVKVKTAFLEYTTNPSIVLSKKFEDGNGEPLDLAGVVREGGRVLKSWDETVMSSGDRFAYLSTYAMEPSVKRLRIQQSGSEMSIAIVDKGGYNCRIASSGSDPSPAAGGGSSQTSLEYFGIVEEEGLVLRHFRMYMTDELKKTRRLAEKNGGYYTGRRLTEAEHLASLGLMESGQVPNYMDYFDIDDDPSGKRAVGSPYRIRYASTVPGSAVFEEKTYLSLSPLPSVLDTKGILEYLGMATVQREAGADASSCPCDLDDAPSGAVPAAMCTAVSSYPAAAVAVELPEPHMPFGETQYASTYFAKGLLKDQQEMMSEPSRAPSVAYELAMRHKYWFELLGRSANLQVIMGQSVPLVDDSDDTSRRLAYSPHSGDCFNKASTWCCGGQLTYSVLFSQKYPVPPWKTCLTKISIGSYKWQFTRGVSKSRKHVADSGWESRYTYSLGLSLDPMSFSLSMVTNWWGQVQSLTASVSGKADMYGPIPRVPVTLTGSISYSKGGTSSGKLALDGKKVFAEATWWNPEVSFSFGVSVGVSFKEGRLKSYNGGAHVGLNIFIGSADLSVSVTYGPARLTKPDEGWVWNVKATYVISSWIFGSATGSVEIVKNEQTM